MHKRKMVPILLLIMAMVFLSCHNKRRTYRVVSFISGEYICISMKNLMTVLDNEYKKHDSISSEIKTIGGISWLEGYVVDLPNSDIILFGKKKGKRIGYNIGDLLVNYKNVFNCDTCPYCSLDPIPENILKLNKLVSLNSYMQQDFSGKLSMLREATGPQKVRLGGIPYNSVHAFTMIDADYHMKKVSQGLIELPGVDSYLGRFVKASTNNNKHAHNSMARFWFHIKKNDNANKYPNFTAGENTVLINECPVVLLTERQITDKKGNLRDDSESDPIAEDFAKNMTEKFSSITDIVELYAHLENLYRLHAIFHSIRFRNEMQKSGINIEPLLMNYSFSTDTPLPPTMPGLANLKEFHNEKTTGNQIIHESSFFMVCGGVGMDMKVDEKSFFNKNKALLNNFGENVVKSRPDRNSVCWKLVVAPQKITRVRIN